MQGEPVRSRGKRRRLEAECGAAACQPNLYEETHLNITATGRADWLQAELLFTSHGASTGLREVRSMDSPSPRPRTLIRTLLSSIQFNWAHFLR